MKKQFLTLLMLLSIAFAPTTTNTTNTNVDDLFAVLAKLHEKGDNSLDYQQRIGTGLGKGIGGVIVAIPTAGISAFLCAAGTALYLGAQNDRSAGIIANFGIVYGLAGIASGIVSAVAAYGSYKGFNEAFIANKERVIYNNKLKQEKKQTKITDYFKYNQQSKK